MRKFTKEELNKLFGAEKIKNIYSESGLETVVEELNTGCYCGIEELQGIELKTTIKEIFREYRSKEECVANEDVEMEELEEDFIGYIFQNGHILCIG